MTEQMSQALQQIENSESTGVVVAGFHSKDGFDLMLRQAKWLSTSDLVPKQFKGNIANTVIALEIATRMGASPLAVMQNLYIVHGKPGWSAQFITAAVNSTGKFSPLRFQVTGEGDSKVCVAWALEKATGERLESPPVSIAMAKAEGWYGKDGSKWKTMPDLMLRYRAATFFGRLYAPEVLMGMKTVEEINDVDEPSVEETIRAHANQGFIDVEPEYEPPDTEPEPVAQTEAKAEETAQAGAESEPEPKRSPGF